MLGLDFDGLFYGAVSVVVVAVADLVTFVVVCCGGGSYSSKLFTLLSLCRQAQSHCVLGNVSLGDMGLDSLRTA